MEDQLLKVLFNTDVIIVTVCTFLSINDIYILCVMDSSLRSTLGISYILSRIAIKEVILGVYDLLNMKKSSQACINIIVNNNSSNCIRGTLHPFRVNGADRQCTTIQQITPDFDRRKHRMLTNRSYYIYQLFKSPMFIKYCHIFKYNALCQYIQLYIPFANNGVSDKYLYRYSIDQFKSVVDKINIISLGVSKIHEKLWQSFSIKFRYNSASIYPFISSEINYNPNQIIDCFKVMYSFELWRRYIDWKHFYIAGDAVTLSLLVTDAITDNIGVDIFALNLTYEQYWENIMQFITNLVNGRKYFQMNSMDSGSVVIYIFIHGRQLTPIRLRFVYTCKHANIMQTLSGFNLASTQVCLRPQNMELSCTASFIYFLKTSKCLVYNLRGEHITEFILSSKLERLIKHKKNGIASYEVPNTIDIAFIKSMFGQFVHIGEIESSYNNTRYTAERARSLITSFSGDFQRYNPSKICSIANYNNIDYNEMFSDFINNLFTDVQNN